MTFHGKVYATVLESAADDWVKMYEVAGIVEWALQTSDMSRVRKVSCETADRLARAGLVEIGDYTSTGFVPWDQPLPEALARINRRWDYAVAHADSASRPGLPTFQHDVCWLNASADGWELGWISALSGYRGGIPSAELRGEIAEIRSGYVNGPKAAGVGGWVLVAVAAEAHLSGTCTVDHIAEISGHAVELARFGSSEEQANEVISRLRILGLTEVDDQDGPSTIRLNAAGHAFATQVLTDQEDEEG